MKTISLLILFVLLFLTNNYIYSQTPNNPSVEIDCPCMLEYDFNSDVKENLNAGADFHPVLKLINAEVKDGMMFCNYEKVFYKLNADSGFVFVSSGNLKDKWTNKGLAVINYYNSQTFEASILNYIYGDIASAKFDDSFKSFSLSDSSNASLYLKSDGEIKLNQSQNGFLITRHDLFKMKALSPASGVPTQLGKKRIILSRQIKIT